MCIRDRHGGHRDLPFPRLAEPTLVRKLLQHAGALPFGVGPVAVSYTHLRAHETVLDLVCRLLLEKKKKTTTQLKVQVDRTQRNKKTYTETPKKSTT